MSLARLVEFVRSLFNSAEAFIKVVIRLMTRITRKLASTHFAVQKVPLS